MRKKIILILLGFAFLFSYSLVKANVVINEIMYMPATGSKYEWVEIYNSGDSQIDLNKYRFCRNDKCDDSGPITLKQGDSTILQPSKYAIIAKSPAIVSDYTWLDFYGIIFSATFSLPDNSSTNNTYIAISDSNKVILDYVKYDTSLGGNKDTNTSLSKINNVWRGATPTPGKENETINTPSPDSSSSSGSASSNIPVVSSSTQGSPELKTKIAEIPKIKTKITAKTLAFIGIPIDFSASTTGYSNELLNYGKYFWNFGDGDSKETKASDTEKFAHTFFYEGEYTVALEYYQNYYSENPDAFDKIIIKVVSTDVFISKVGDEKDFFVEISNNTNYDADISKWILLSKEKSFTFPKNTILQPKKKIILSPKITGFSILDKDTLKLTNPQWETVFDYSSPIIIEPVKILAKKSATISTAMSTVAEIPFGGETAKLENEQIPAYNLEATAIKSDSSAGNNIMYGIGLIAFLGISASGAYFVRNRNRIKKDSFGIIGNDFEIIDE